MPIRYPLEALIRTRQWELDLLRQKMVEMRGTVAMVEAVVEKLHDQIVGAEAALTQDGAQGRIIFVERRKLLTVFLKDRRRQLARERSHLVEEQGRLSETMEELTSVRRALKALERHKERFAANLNIVAERNFEKTLDELWSRRNSAPSYE